MGWMDKGRASEMGRWIYFPPPVRELPQYPMNGRILQTCPQHRKWPQDGPEWGACSRCDRSQGCDTGQVLETLWATVSPSVKRG